MNLGEPLRLLGSLALCLVILAGCSSFGPPLPDGPASVLVVRRGWHIDVGFDVRDLRGPLSFVGTQFPSAHFVFFGFGDERYIRASHHRVPALLAAAWPGSGVMLVTAIENTPAQAFGAASVARVPMTFAQQTSVQSYIGASFARSSDERVPLQEGPYAGSLYYAATPTYSGVHTCNTWAAETLRAAGLPVHSDAVVLAGQLWSQVRPLDRSERTGVP